MSNMVKIKDLTIGSATVLPLVVLSATPRETKAKKPYLQLELYDGTDSIQGNYWDWISGKIPEKNTILDVSAQVTEYMGTKQLNIKSLSTNTDRHLSEFEPSSGVDMSSIYMEAYSLVADVKDDFLRSTALEVLEQLKHELLVIPGAKSVHHAFVGGTLVHSLQVAKIAKAMSGIISESNDDLCFVGGLLHDIGKLYTYRLNGIVIDMTDEGMLYDHVFIGANFIGNFVENNGLIKTEKDSSKLELLQHIILSHHGCMEYGATVPPMCIEAHIVHSADGVDAAVQQVIEASNKLGETKWTDRIWALSNRPQLTTQYVKKVFKEEIPEEELQHV